MHSAAALQARLLIQVAIVNFPVKRTVLFLTQDFWDSNIKVGKEKVVFVPARRSVCCSA